MNFNNAISVSRILLAAFSRSSNRELYKELMIPVLLYSMKTYDIELHLVQDVFLMEYSLYGDIQTFFESFLENSGEDEIGDNIEIVFDRLSGLESEEFESLLIQMKCNLE